MPIGTELFKPFRLGRGWVAVFRGELIYAPDQSDRTAIVLILHF
jgi:hypothetical protein